MGQEEEDVFENLARIMEAQGFCAEDRRVDNWRQVGVDMLEMLFEGSVLLNKNGEVLAVGLGALFERIAINGVQKRA